MIPALVLTAGLATRLRPLSFVRAKAALPVGDEPLAARILRWLSAAGVTDAVLNLHHLPHTLTARIGDGSHLGVRVRYSWENPVLGSAGGPKRALSLVDHDTFLIINGDTLTDVDLRAVIEDHDRSGALVTMAAVPNREPGKYSGLRVDDAGRLTGVVKRGAAEPSWHFFGVQVVDRRAFDTAPDGLPYETVGALYPSLIAAERGSVRVHRTAAEYLDIGTPADYLETVTRLAEREQLTCIGRGSRVDPGAQLIDSIVWDDVVVGEGAMLRDCVVTDGAHVPADTSWHGVTLRAYDGTLGPTERRINGLAIGSL